MKKYSDLDERVLTNLVNQLDGDSISRSRARYPIVDVPSSDFDAILQRNGIRRLNDKKTGGEYYLASEIKRALREYCLKKGIRPKVNAEKLRDEIPNSETQSLHRAVHAI